MAYPELPHFAAPFTYGPGGVVNAVEQRSVEEIAACVYNIASCTIGFRGDLPDFGVPDVTFATAPINTSDLQAAIARWEPRADLAVREFAQAVDQSQRTVTVDVGV